MELKYKFHLIIISCFIILFFLIILISNNYLDKSLKFSTQSNLKLEINLLTKYINRKFPGSWIKKGDFLYKGSIKITHSNKFIENINELNKNDITIFLNNNIIASNTFKNSNSFFERELNKEITNLSSKENGFFLGRSKILRENFAYKEIIIKKNIIKILLGKPYKKLSILKLKLLKNIICIYSFIFLLLFILFFYFNKRCFNTSPPHNDAIKTSFKKNEQENLDNEFIILIHNIEKIIIEVKEGADIIKKNSKEVENNLEKTKVKFTNSVFE